MMMAPDGDGMASCSPPCDYCHEECSGACSVGAGGQWQESGYLVPRHFETCTRYRSSDGSGYRVSELAAGQASGHRLSPRKRLLTRRLQANGCPGGPPAHRTPMPPPR